MLSLPDSPVIESVIRGPGGLLEHARDGQVIVDLSTANPASTRALHDELRRHAACATWTPGSPAAPRARRRAR